MKFSYAALSRDNRKMTGSLEARSLEAAERQLQKMELSILALKKGDLEMEPDVFDLSLDPSPSEKKPSEITTYSFLGKKKNGAEVNGMIDSKDPYLAFKKLQEDYQFEVLELSELKKNGDEIDFKSNFSHWSKRFKQENQGKAHLIDSAHRETILSPPENIQIHTTDTSLEEQKEERIPLQKEPPSLKEIGKAYFNYFTEKNPLLKQVKKQTLEKLKALRTVYNNQQEQAEMKLRLSRVGSRGKRDFSAFFMELNSFVGWLLFFYIGYFFLASFTLERNVGLSHELVIKTFTSPLILNIFIFLLVTHLTLKLKLRLFYQNTLGSIFLFGFSYGLYALLVSNF